MTGWVDRIAAHQVWGSISNASIAVDVCLARDFVTPEMTDSLQRLRAIILVCKDRLALAHPTLLATSALDAINQALLNITAQLDLFGSTQDPGQILLANMQADVVMTSLSTVAISSVATTDGSVSEAFLAYRRSLESGLLDVERVQSRVKEIAVLNESNFQQIDLSMRAEFDQLKLSLQEKYGQLEALATEQSLTIANFASSISSEQQRLAVLVSEFHSIFSATQDKRASDFSTAQSDFLSKFTELLTTQQTEFSTDQATRRSVFLTTQEENQGRINSEISEVGQRLKSNEDWFIEQRTQTAVAHGISLQNLTEEYSSSAAAILDEIRAQQSMVEKLVGVIGTLGVTSGYQKVADYAKKMLLVWQGLTISALVGLIILATFIAFPSHPPAGSNIPAALFALHQSNAGVQPKLDPVALTLPETKGSITVSDSEFYRSFAARIFLSVSIGVFAAYSGRQASHFFNIEQRNRKLALELEALGPFIAPLEKADADKFRVQVGDRSFGLPANPNPRDVDPVTALDLAKKSKEGLESLAAQLRTLLKEISEKTKE